MSRRPNFGGMGMGGMNMQQMMKQAKKLQAQMAEVARFLFFPLISLPIKLVCIIKLL